MEEKQEASKMGRWKVREQELCGELLRKEKAYVLEKTKREGGYNYQRKAKKVVKKRG